MKIFLYVILILFNISANSNTIEVIELHENKSLDQLVLDKIENENTCETCRSVMYYYMRIIFIEVIKQHTSNMHRSRAYTI